MHHRISFEINDICIIIDINTHILFPWPNFPSSPSPQEKILPSIVNANACRPPKNSIYFSMVKVNNNNSIIINGMTVKFNVQMMQS